MKNKYGLEQVKKEESEDKLIIIKKLLEKTTEEHSVKILIYDFLKGQILEKEKRTRFKKNESAIK